MSFHSNKLAWPSSSSPRYASEPDLATEKRKTGSDHDHTKLRILLSVHLALHTRACVIVCVCGKLSSASSAAGEPYDPLPAPGATINSSSARITVLRPGLFRLQLGHPQDLDDRATFQVVNRHSSPVPSFRDVSAELPPGSLGVATAAANLTVQPNGLVSFECEGRAGWQWSSAQHVGVGGKPPSAVEEFGAKNGIVF